MKTLPVTALTVEPDFDLPTFLFLAQIEEMGPQEILTVLNVWEKWLPLLKIHQLGQRKGHVLIFLDQAVEDEVDAVWEESPAQGFKYEAIAQTMIMGTLKVLMPELGAEECAPVPEPTRPLRRTIQKLGLTMQESGALSRKYATITPYPYRYGCERCYLKDSCIKNMNLDLSDLMPAKAKD